MRPIPPSHKPTEKQGGDASNAYSEWHPLSVACDEGVGSSNNSSSEDNENSNGEECDDSIPKPPGSVGKPKNGGYSLLSVLDWDPIDYHAVQKHHTIFKLAHANAGLSEDKKFLMLRQCADHGATKDFLKMYLQNTLTFRKWKRTQITQVTLAAGTTHEIKEAKRKLRKTVHWAK
ncbi:hypothetical protein K439DRAFT_1622507 [Ramaria rubella]|nr:hypothetical protein K439DRAFT_1622507 [Ramaria rubella]